MSEGELAARLEAFLARRTEAKRVRVSALRRLTGGASRETWSLDAELDRGRGEETLPLIWQRDVRGAPKELSRALEYRLMGAACAAGVPAPEPLWSGDETLGGGESFFVRRIEGETLPRRLLRDERYAHARSALPAQLAVALARIHAVDIGAHGLDALPATPDGVTPAAHEVDRYDQVLRGVALEPHPAFELAFRWLRQHPLIAQPVQPRLVHGDFRIGNVLFDEEGLRVVLDWELAHVGDPVEDIGFLCVRSWRFGGPGPVGGIGEREDFFAAYEAAGGAPVDRERARFWEVFGNLRWGVICLGQARVYIDGRSDSVELAAIGRRTAETEWELLELIE